MLLNDFLCLFLWNAGIYTVAMMMALHYDAMHLTEELIEVNNQLNLQIWLSDLEFFILWWFANEN